MKKGGGVYAFYFGDTERGIEGRLSRPERKYILTHDTRLDFVYFNMLLCWTHAFHEYLPRGLWGSLAL
jgi:hypothetical protein